MPVASGEVALSTNFFFNGGYFSEPENRLRQSAYGVWDGALSWKRSRVEVRLWVKNLLDKAYAAQLAALEDGDLRVAAPGRTFGATLGYRF